MLLDKAMGYGVARTTALRASDEAGFGVGLEIRLDIGALCARAPCAQDCRFYAMQSNGWVCRAPGTMWHWEYSPVHGVKCRTTFVHCVGFGLE